jgi:hypothetical protein
MLIFVASNLSIKNRGSPIVALTFVRFTLRLTLIFVASLLAVRLFGSLRPPSTLTLITSAPNGARCDHPCLFGIRPGLTSIDEAVRILHNHPLTRDATWQNDHTLQLAGPSAYVAFSRTPDGMVDSITLTDNLTDTGVHVPGSLADSYALGDLILAFGASSVSLPGSNYFVVNVPEIGITAAAARPSNNRMQMQATTPLSMLMISVFRPCPTEPIIATVHPWLGFKTIRQYYRDTGTYNIPTRVSGVPIPPYATCHP